MGGGGGGGEGGGLFPLTGHNVPDLERHKKNILAPSPRPGVKTTKTTI